MTTVAAARRTDPIPVLCYHSVGPRRVAELAPWELEPAVFDDQLAFLHERKFHPVPLGALANWLREPEAHPLPERPVVITFDDGYTNFEAAVAILEYHRVPTTLFVPTAHVGDKSDWYGTSDARAARIMSWDAIADVHRAGVEIGAHSHHHVALDELPPPDAEREIVRSKELLEDKLATSIAAFAYPFGYYDAHVRRVVCDSGFDYACAVKNWTSGGHDDPFAIARIFPPTTGDLDTFERLLQRGYKRPRRREALRTKAWRVVRRSRARRAHRSH